MGARIKRYFATGLLIVVPLYISIYVLSLIVGFMDNVFEFLPRWAHPDAYLPFHIPGLGVIAAAIIILVVGILATNLFGKLVVSLGEKLISKVPILRMLYNATKQFMETFLSSEHAGLKKVVIIEFPSPGAYSMGFQTSRLTGDIKDKTGDDMVGVFVPTAPNITTGFYVIVKQSAVRYVDLSVEDALKVILSAGMIMPDKNNALHNRP